MTSLKRIWPVVLVIFGLLLVFDLKVLSSHDWDPLALVLLTPDDLPEGQTWGKGYDGRFTYHIAVNPLGAVEGLDVPSFRYQRILYPLLVKVFSLGRVEWAAWVMLAINLLAAGLGSGVLGRLLARRGSSPWLALPLFLSVGYLLAIRMDLLEPLTLTLALAGWLAGEEEKPALAGALFALAGLTKEIGLVFAGVFGVWELLRGQKRSALVILVGSFLPFIAWYLFLVSRFGVTQEAIERSRFLWLPFSGIRYLVDPISRGVVILWVLLPASVGAVWAGWDLFREGLRTPVARDALLVMAYTALISVLPQPTWVDPLALLRFSLGLITAVLLWLSCAHKRWLPLALGLWLPSGLILWPIPGMF